MKPHHNRTVPRTGQGSGRQEGLTNEDNVRGLFLGIRSRYTFTAHHQEVHQGGPRCRLCSHWTAQVHVTAGDRPFREPSRDRRCQGLPPSIYPEPGRLLLQVPLLFYLYLFHLSSLYKFFLQSWLVFH